MKCTHHYILDAPDGANTKNPFVSIGVCKKCGNKKAHSNDPETNKVILRQIRKGQWRPIKNFVIGNGTPRVK